MSAPTAFSPATLNTSECADQWAVQDEHHPIDLIAWLTHRLGLGELGGGSFATDARMANRQALRLAHDRALASGAARESLCVLTTEAARFETRAVADGLGLGPQAVVGLDVDHRGRMDVEELRHTLTALAIEGRSPIAVIATAGTPERGAIDALAAIAAVCSVHDVWLHVHAPIGGELAASHRYRHLLSGIGCADSVTVDLPQTWCASPRSTALLLRDRSMLTMLDDLGSRGPHHQHRPQVHQMDVDAVGSWFDASLDLAQTSFYIAEEFHVLEVLERPMTNRVVFRFTGGPDFESPSLSELALDTVNASLADAMKAQHAVSLASTHLMGQTWLTCVLLSPTITAADVRATFEWVASHGRRLATAAVAGRG